MAKSRTAFLIGTSGIGGAVWHQPALKALAETRGPLTVFARKATRTGDLFLHEPYVERVIEFDRARGPRHVKCFLDLVAAFKAAECDESWIFHDKTYYAAAAFFGGVRNRYGFGAGIQKLYLNRGETIRQDRSLCGEGGIVESARVMLRRNGIAIGDETPRLTVRPGAVEAVLARIGDLPRPWYVLGATCLEERRRWSPEGFAILARRLVEQGGGTALFTGAPDHAWQVAQTTQHLAPGGPWRDLSRDGLPLTESIAVMQQSVVYIGNDSGPLNIAAALEVPAYGLFGDHEPHGSLSPEIRIILPDPRLEGPTGMSRISPDAILARLAADGFNPGHVRAAASRQA